MRKFLAFLSAAVAALGLLVSNSGNAMASGEWLGCRIGPGYQVNFYPTCTTAAPPDEYGNYAVAFVVQNEAVSSTYSWTTYGYPIATGCSSTTSWCTVLAGGGEEIQVSSHSSRVPTSKGLSATAYTPKEVCNPYCL